MVKDKNLFALDHCPVCDKEVGIAFDKRMKELPEHVVTSPFLCDNCKQYMIDNDAFVMYESHPPKRIGSNGLAIDMPQITGKYVIMSMKFFNEAPEKDPGYLFTKEHRICFCDEEFFNKITKKDK